MAALAFAPGAAMLAGFMYGLYCIAYLAIAYSGNGCRGSLTTVKFQKIGVPETLSYCENRAHAPTCACWNSAQLTRRLVPVCSSASYQRALVVSIAATRKSGS